MAINSCMGNPKNKAQCESCKRLPRTRDGTLDDNITAWIDWKKVKTPCMDAIAIDAEE